MHRGDIRRGIPHAMLLDHRAQPLHCLGVLRIGGNDHLVDGGLGEGGVVRIGQDAGLSRPREPTQDCEGQQSCRVLGAVFTPMRDLMCAPARVRLAKTAIFVPSI